MGPVVRALAVTAAVGVAAAVPPAAAMVAPVGGPVAGPVAGTPSGAPAVEAADAAATDGRLLARLVGPRLVLTDVAGARPRELSRTELPADVLGGPGPVLLLEGDRVLVVGSEPGPRLGGPLPWVPGPAQRILPPSGRPLPGEVAVPGGPTHDHLGTVPEHRFALPSLPPVRSHVVTVSVADATRPRVVSDRDVAGEVLAARGYADGTVRVVTRTSVPGPLPPCTWLGLGDDGPHQRIMCPMFRRSPRLSGPGTVRVLTLPADGSAGETVTSVSGGGDVVSSSADRLYVASSRGPASTVQAFALDGTRTTYVGSARLPGPVRDRWSMSEHGGALRVLVAVGGDPWQPRENAVVVLAERGGRLVTTGRLDGIGRHEQVSAVRWLGDLAVVVTAGGTDPVWTVDLSDPTHPSLRGELRLPGSSSYLHPVAPGLLVDLGRDTRGAKPAAAVTTLDVRDPGHVRRLAGLDLGAGTATGAESDARSLLYLRDWRTLLVAVDDPSVASGSQVLALHVGRDGDLRRTGSWATRCAAATVRELALGGGRVALVDDRVRVVRVLS